MSLPFFETLQHCFPHDRIDVIAKDTVQEVFRYHPAVDRVHTFSKSRIKGLYGLLTYGRTLQRQHGPYDLFISIPASLSSAIIGYGVGSRVRLGFRGEGRSVLLTHAFSAPHGRHRAHIYRSLLASLNSRQAPADWNMQRVLDDHEITTLAFPFSDDEGQMRMLDKQPGTIYIVFSVNAEAQSRRLPLEKWRVFGNRLLNDPGRHVVLVFVGAPKEQDRVAKVVQGLEDQDRVLNFAGKTTVRELALLLRDADAVVANDSGPMHLANAVGTPLVTHIGAADPIETEPFNKARTRIISKYLPCSPCVKNTCPFPTVYCLEHVTVDDLYSSLMDLLAADKRA